MLSAAHPDTVNGRAYLLLPDLVKKTQDKLRKFHPVGDEPNPGPGAQRVPEGCTNTDTISPQAMVQQRPAVITLQPAQPNNQLIEPDTKSNAPEKEPAPNNFRSFLSGLPSDREFQQRLKIFLYSYYILHEE